MFAQILILFLFLLLTINNGNQLLKNQFLLMLEKMSENLLRSFYLLKEHLYIILYILLNYIIQDLNKFIIYDYNFYICVYKSTVINFLY
jgi:hypothetical protein